MLFKGSHTFDNTSGVDDKDHFCADVEGKGTAGDYKVSFCYGEFSGNSG